MNLRKTYKEAGRYKEQRIMDIFLNLNSFLVRDMLELFANRIILNIMYIKFIRTLNILNESYYYAYVFEVQI